MKLHVLTLNWNGLHYLKDLYNPLMESFENAGFKNGDAIWHIRDNGSKDGTVDYIKKEKWNNVAVYDIGHNRDSFSKGNNFLAKEAGVKDDDLILLLNNDVKIPDVYALNKMKKLLLSDDSFGVCGARLHFFNSNKVQHVGLVFLNDKDKSSKFKFGKLPYHFRYNLDLCNEDLYNRYFQAVTAAVALVKAKDFIKVGGFCEDYFFALEDVDLCLKIGQYKKNIYCGEAMFYHEESASCKKNNYNKLKYDNNILIYKQKWFDIVKTDYNEYYNIEKYNVI
jgi:GT2 family glycosyltransferase